MRIKQTGSNSTRLNLSKSRGLKIPKERQEQIMLVQYLKARKIPHYAIPNGGSRNKIEAARMKAEGISAGVPDICIPVPNKHYHGLYIEMKRRKGGVVSEKQKKWIETLNNNGYLAVVCRGFEEARGVVEEYIKTKDRNE